MSPKVAIIQFPGSNCEYETLRAMTHYGLEADIIRWNCDESTFKSYSAYCLPGGFSFQDRVRAGAIAARLPIMEFLKSEAAIGKPVLGICNGCQILAEAGLLAETHAPQVDVSLSHNTNAHKPVGFICDWVFVKVKNSRQNVFTYYLDEPTVLPIPINHGEGHFCFKSDVDFDRAHLAYCDANGNELTHFPINPNGSHANIAGYSNKAGNVFAMMPHPERASFVKQIPGWIHSDWSDKKRAHLLGQNDNNEGPWAALFKGLYDVVHGSVRVEVAK